MSFGSCGIRNVYLFAHDSFCFLVVARPRSFCSVAFYCACLCCVACLFISWLCWCAWMNLSWGSWCGHISLSLWWWVWLWVIFLLVMVVCVSRGCIFYDCTCSSWRWWDMDFVLDVRTCVLVALVAPVEVCDGGVVIVANCMWWWLLQPCEESI